MTKEFCDIDGRPIEAQHDGKIMTKRRGRPPKNDKRDDSYRLRLNAEERQILEQISEQTEQPISTVIRKAILAYYETVNMEEKPWDLLENVKDDWIEKIVNVELPARNVMQS